MTLWAAGSHCRKSTLTTRSAGTPPLSPSSMQWEALMVSAAWGAWSAMTPSPTLGSLYPHFWRL